MGRATAMLFAADGARVALVDLPRSAVSEVAESIRSLGGDVVAIEADLALPDDIARVAVETRAAFGPIDIVVNNAGVSAAGLLSGDDFEDAWAQSITVNLTAQMRLVRACLGDLQRNGDGRIVNIASTEGLAATLGSPAYTAAKHGVVGLTKAMAVEFGPSGVTANCICPGPINTGMTEAIPDDAKQKYVKRRVPMRRYADPEEVAHMTLSLVLPAASFVTGAVVTVDGGLSVKSN